MQSTTNHSFLAETAQNMFFLFGCGRSGTSLLRSMLSQHPQMVVANETQFYHTLYRRYHKTYGELTDSESFATVLNEVLNYWSIRDLNLDHQKIRALCDKAEPSWETMMLAIFTVLRETHAAKCVGDKNPSYFQYLEMLNSRYPTAKFVHIVRDPRAVCLSFRHVDVGPSQLAEVLERWGNAVTAHFKYCDKLGESRLHLIRYEDLVTQTEAELSRLCQFLNLDMSAEMLKHHDRQQSGFSEHQSGHQGNTLKPLFTSSLDKWRTKLSQTEIGLIEFQAGKAMQKLGYELTDAPVSAPKLRLAVSSAFGKVDRCTRWMKAKRKQNKAA